MRSKNLYKELKSRNELGMEEEMKRSINNYINSFVELEDEEMSDEELEFRINSYIDSFVELED